MTGYAIPRTVPQALARIATYREQAIGSPTLEAARFARLLDDLRYGLCVAELWKLAASLEYVPRRGKGHPKEWHVFEILSRLIDRRPSLKIAKPTPDEEQIAHRLHLGAYRRWKNMGRAG